MAKRNRYLLVVDVGTGSGRAVIFDESGKQVAVAQREWTHPADPGCPGAVDFDCPRNWKRIGECIRGSIRQAGIHGEEIAAVSATSLRYGLVCFDASGEVVFATPNVDARAEAETAELVRGGWGPKIYEIQGEWPNIHALVRLLWLKKNKPQVFERVRMVTMLAEWVIHRLCGEYAAEPSSASSSLLFDIRSRTWSEPLARLAGLEMEYLPRVMNPGDRVGEVTRQAAEQTGLAAGTPVMIGMGDTQSGHVGSGVIHPGDVGLIAGTFWLPGVAAAEPLLDPQRRTRTNCHALPGQWIVEGCTFLTGQAIRWFRDAFCREEVERARQMGCDPYELMERLAEQVPPGSYGLQVILSDVLNSSRWIHAAPAFINFGITDPQGHGKAAFYRAILENAVYQAVGEVEGISRVYGSRPKEVIFSGGGSKSPLLAQALADALTVPVRVPVVREATSLGAAATSACGAGLYGSLEEACGRFVRFERLYESDPRRAEIYREGYRTWRAIYPHMMALVENGLTQPLWKAPATL